MKDLTGHDYMNRPMLELQSHPDFSQEAHDKIACISAMTSKELEEINLIGGSNE